MHHPTTYLAAGQRYAHPSVPAWRGDQQITILVVGIDGSGCVFVTYRCPDGRQVSGKATQFEAAVAGGKIVPITAPGRMAAC